MNDVTIARADPGIQLKIAAMASTLRQPIKWDGGAEPQRDLRAETVVRRSGGQSPQKLKDIHFLDALRRTKFGALSNDF